MMADKVALTSHFWCVCKTIFDNLIVLFGPRTINVAAAVVVCLWSPRLRRSSQTNRKWIDRYNVGTDHPLGICQPTWSHHVQNGLSLVISVLFAWKYKNIQILLIRTIIVFQIDGHLWNLFLILRIQITSIYLKIMQNCPYSQKTECR